MLYSIKQQVLAMDGSNFFFMIVFFTVICIGSLYFIFRFFYRGRMIKDTPTAKIRSAAQGYVELEGRGLLMDGMPIVSPVSQRPCLWYKYSIAQRRHSLGFSNNFSSSRNSWEVIESGESDDLFLLNDGSGLCVIDPDGAAITPSFSKTWYGSSMQSSGDRLAQSRQFSFGALGGNNYRFTEKRIELNAQLYLLGRFKTVGGRRETLDKSAEIRDLLAQWKKHPQNLLARFDENGDGQIDLQEWQRVMDAASKEINQKAEEGFTQQEMHTLSKPRDSRHPFIISVESQKDILTRYQRFSIGSIMLFFASGISLVWILGIRMS